MLLSQLSQGLLQLLCTSAVPQTPLVSMLECPGQYPSCCALTHVQQNSEQHNIQAGTTFSVK